MSPTPRSAAYLAAASLSVLLVPPWIAALFVVGLLAAIATDAWIVRRPPVLERSLPHVLSRGVPTQIHASAISTHASRVTLRQGAPPDLRVDPDTGEKTLEATVTALRRGRHLLPPVGARSEGPLGLGYWYHKVGEDQEVLVYPDLIGARRLAESVRRGRFRDPGRHSRGPMGLGTEFESIRDYLPDDDIRQVNWKATLRMGRAMSNQYRIEQDRQMMCLLDTGRLMAAPLHDRTRLDAAVDVVTALSVVADELGDRCGLIAFDASVKRHLDPRRAGARRVVSAIFDLEPSENDSDYERAFHLVGSAKRSFVVVFTDLIDEAAARSLVEAIPVLARHHSLVVATAADPDLDELIGARPEELHDVLAASIAIDVLAARRTAVAQLRGAGAEVIQAPAGTLAGACIGAYLRAKARARL